MADIVQRIESEEEDEWKDTAPYRIASYPADYTLEVLHKKWKNEDLIVVDFQRQFVWTLAQASRLIESFLLGLPVPGIFLYKERRTGKLIVIDGLQRLTSVFSYIDGTFPVTEKAFRLFDLREEWEGRLYADLTDSDRRRFRDSVLRAIIVDQISPTDDSSMFEIFHRLNTGGTTLTPQEIRNCIHRGSFNNALKKMNQDPNWRAIFGPQKPDKRMRDVELILRFLALHGEGRKYAKPMKDFISSYMKKHREAPASWIRRKTMLFTSTTAAIVKTLGKKPFNLWSGINAAACDAVMVAYANNLGETIPSDIRERYVKGLLHDQKFLKCVSTATTDLDTVRDRLSFARSRLFNT